MPQSPLPDVSFIGGIFDFSFTTFITTRVIKVLYALYLVGLVLLILGGLGTAVMMMVNNQIVLGLVYIILMPFFAFVYLLVGRMWHELIIVTFRISENVAEINRKTRG